MLRKVNSRIVGAVCFAALTFCANADGAMQFSDPDFDAFSIPSLVGKLKNDQVEIRRKAAEDLAGYAAIARVCFDEATVAALETSLQDKDSQVRASSICALMLASPISEAVMPRIITLLSDDDVEVRQVSAQFLAYRRANSKLAYAALQKALNDKDAIVRIRAACAILVTSPTVKAAQLVLTKGLENEDPEIRTSVTYAFGDIGIPGVSVLRAAIKDNNRIVRLNATRAMTRIASNLSAIKAKEFPTDAIRALIDLLDHKDKETVYSAIYALGTIGQPAKAAVPKIADLLNDPDPSVRYIAASELREFRDAAKVAIPGLIQSLKDQDWRVRRAAKETLEPLQKLRE